MCVCVCICGVVCVWCVCGVCVVWCVCICKCIGGQYVIFILILSLINVRLILCEEIPNALSLSFFHSVIA